MDKQETAKLQGIVSEIVDLQRGLRLLSKEKDIKINFNLELSLEQMSLNLENVRVVYSINGSKGEVLEFLVVNAIKNLLYDWEVEFLGYDKDIEATWDYYNDCMHDGTLYEDVWETYTEDGEEEKTTVRLTIEDSKELVNQLRLKKLPTYFSISIDVTRDRIEVGVESEESLLNDRNPYLEYVDMVNVLTTIYHLGDNTKDKMGKVVLKPKSKQVDGDAIDEEFIKNINEVLTNKKFRNLVQDCTIEESDSSSIYIDTYTKKATLTRFFEGYNYHLNTVHDLPLTLTTSYQVEDKATVVSTASPRWVYGDLSGRHSRNLFTAQDYYKFDKFIRQHFPSLVTDEGTLKAMKMRIQLGDVLPKEVVSTVEGYKVNVLGEDTLGSYPKQRQSLAVIGFEYGGARPQKEDEDKFLEEYKEFKTWVNKNLK